jgi:ArsR family transcriptional regulator, arsenate/arsenite/antimonite-responsive transcriptional repressor
VIWVRREEKYFCKWDWTANSLICPSGNQIDLKGDFSSVIPGLRQVAHHDVQLHIGEWRSVHLLDRPPYIGNSGYMESEDAILALAALAQPTRLDVFRLLVKQEPEGLAAGDIARALAVPQNTMSSHLSILSRAGLVSAQRFSRSIVYRADLARFRTVVLFMLKDCCDGRPEICAPLIEDLAPCCPPKSKRKAQTHV